MVLLYGSTPAFPNTSKEVGQGALVAGKGFGCPHCVEQAGEELTLYRVFVPGPNAKPKHVLYTITFETGEALSHL